MNYHLDTIRDQIIGNDLAFYSPFGQKHMFYADFTASGRCLNFIEDALIEIQKSYANTHTEDDYTGKFTTQLLHAAEANIKRLVNAGPGGKIIPIGSGTTGALKKLLEIIGVYIPPVTYERILQGMKASGQDVSAILAALEQQKPVVFIGPYEHHTNELMWREAFVDVEVVGFDANGLLNMVELNQKLAEPKLRKRKKIVSISAGSNITGIRTPVYEVAQTAHKYGAWVFFDFAAVAPYVKIDMNRDKDSYFDAIFFSPHKFLGGPGSSGILIFNENIYRKDLPPTAAGGGTVVYVGSQTHDFSEDIEAREKAGTPPILQTIKAALALDLKHKIGIDLIEELEIQYTDYFVSELQTIPNVDLIGNADPKECISIVSFNIQHLDRTLHPKFVTKLLSDLFGIQSRAGCSCAGPYGHVLLDIDNTTSQKLRHLVQAGYEGIKPGWVRINLHFTFTRQDIDFLLKAITFIAENGHLFLPLYSFDLHSSEWKHRQAIDKPVDCSLSQKYAAPSLDLDTIEEVRASYLQQAHNLAVELKTKPEPAFRTDEDEIENLKYFYYV